MEDRRALKKEPQGYKQPTNTTFAIRQNKVRGILTFEKK